MPILCSTVPKNQKILEWVLKCQTPAVAFGFDNGIIYRQIKLFDRIYSHFNGSSIGSNFRVFKEGIEEVAVLYKFYLSNISRYFIITVEIFFLIFWLLVMNVLKNIYYWCLVFAICFFVYILFAHGNGYVNIMLIQHGIIFNQKI